MISPNSAKSAATSNRSAVWGSALLCIGLSVPMTTSCGGNDAPPPPPPGGAPPPRRAARATTSDVETQMVYVANPKWASLEGYFTRFLQEPAASRRDPLRNYITAHVARPELPEQTEEAGEGGAIDDPLAPVAAEPDIPSAESELDKAPLQRYAVDEYQLVLIMSGTVVPKAVVEDPLGNTWVLRRDTPMGNKGGVVESITQYAVIIREPDVDNPVEKTLRPLIFEAAPTLLVPPDDRVFGAERLTGPPL